MPNDDDDDLARAVARALEARRPAPSRELNMRLRAAGSRPPRRSWWLPAGLAAVVAIAAALVIAQRSGRDARDDGEGAPRSVADAPKTAAPTAVPLPAGGGGGCDTAPDPADPALVARIAELERELRELRATIDRMARVDHGMPVPTPHPWRVGRTAVIAGDAADDGDVAPLPEDGSDDDVVDPFAAPRARPTPRPDPRPSATVDPFDVAPSPAPVVAGAAPSTLVVITEPAGAQIVIDGRVVGASPTRLSLDPGVYKVQIDKRGYGSAIAKVLLGSGEKRTVRLSLTDDGDDDAAVDRAPVAARALGTLTIASKPPTQVIVDGKAVGTTPLVARLSVGLHRVVLVDAAHGVRETRVVKIQADGETKLVISLPPHDGSD